MDFYKIFFPYVFGMSVALLLLVACTDESRPPIDMEPIIVPYDPSDTALADMLGNLIVEVKADRDSGLARGRLGMAYEINDFKHAAADSYGQAARLDETEVRWPYF